MNICEKYSFFLYKQLNDAAKTLINSKASTNRYLHVLCIDLWLQQIINSFFKAFISLNICCGNINIPMQYMYFCFHLIIQTYSFCKKEIKNTANEQMEILEFLSIFCQTSNFFIVRHINSGSLHVKSQRFGLPPFITSDYGVIQNIIVVNRYP